MSLNKILLTAILSVSVTASYAQEINYEGEVNGVLMLSVSEFNVKKKEAVPEAVKDAFFNLFFRGIPASKNHKQALLGTSENRNTPQTQYYENLVASNRIYSFVTFTNLTYYKKKEAIVAVSINVDAIIDDLERNNLYKRFGLH